jgi:dephospho-CoA kinase
VPTEEPSKTLMVGLTGGIGAGKSTVAELLARRGAIVIDADVIAREVVEPGTPALAALVERFGADVVDDQGRLDRAALAAKAFVNDEERKALEAITHPAIGAAFLQRIADAPPGSIIVHDIPLLTEAKREGDYAAVIVVEAPLPVRLDRLEDRGVPRDDAVRRIALQATDEERRAIATWVLDNAGDVAALDAQLDQVWAELQKLVAQTA